MELTPITRKENFLAKAAGDQNALDLEPITREEWFISQIQGGGGGGGAVSSVNGKTGAVVLDPDDVGAEPEKLVVTVTESGGVYSADKTRDEIATAYNNGKVPVVKFNDDVYELANTDSADFCFSVYIDGKIKQIDLIYTGSDVWSYTEIAVQQDSLKLTATPTAGPSGTRLMSGTWSGATWAEVAAAVLASRLIQIDVANIGKITLLYNLGDDTASSNAFVYAFGGILYNVFVNLYIDAGNNGFNLSIINARTETENVSGTTPTITPAANNIYNCGELTSLTITDPPATGKYTIIFFSGATPTTTVGIENFVAEANKRYKITVEDNYATYDSWPYTPT